MLPLVLAGEVEPVKKEAAEILSGFDRALEKIEAMPVNTQEKKRLIKEWLRSRLSEAFETRDGDPESPAAIDQAN
jgi:hypothetical protein